MEPLEIEFLAENEIISIVPNFNYGKMLLISGDVGPFRAGIPLNVPLWLGISLKNRRRCRIVPPDWMDVEKMEQFKEEEFKSEYFCKPPSEYYIAITEMLLNAAEDDIPRFDTLRTLVKDILDKRLAKLRTSVSTFIKVGGTHAKLDNLTSMEIDSLRPILPHSLDLLNRIRSAKYSTRFRKTQPSTSSSAR